MRARGLPPTSPGQQRGPFAISYSITARCLFTHQHGYLDALSYDAVGAGIYTPPTIGNRLHHGKANNAEEFLVEFTYLI